VILEEETQVLGVKPLPVPLYPPQIPLGQASEGDASGQLPTTRNSLSTYLIHGLTSNFKCNFFFFPHSSEMKIRMRLKSGVLFFTLWESRKRHFPRRTSGLAKRAVSFKDSEIYSLAKIFDSHKKKFLNVTRMMPYHTLSTERQICRFSWKSLLKSGVLRKLECVLNSK